MQATGVKSTALHLPSTKNRGRTGMGQPPVTRLQFDPGFNWPFEGTLAWPIEVAYYLSILFYSSTYVGKKMFSVLCNNWGVQTVQQEAILGAFIYPLLARAWTTMLSIAAKAKRRVHAYVKLPAPAIHLFPMMAALPLPHDGSFASSP